MSLFSTVFDSVTKQIRKIQSGDLNPNFQSVARSGGSFVYVGSTPQVVSFVPNTLTGHINIDLSDVVMPDGAIGYVTLGNVLTTDFADQLTVWYRHATGNGIVVNTNTNSSTLYWAASATSANVQDVTVMVHWFLTVV